VKHLKEWWGPKKNYY